MRLKQYEGMFLFDSGFATDLSKAQAEIRRILDRAGAEVVFCRKWDERKLAYEIQGHKRGTYVLTYFKCPPEAVGGIERDAQLSEPVLRVLLLQADHVTFERMAQFAPEKKIEAPRGAEEGAGRDRETPEARPVLDVIETEAEPVASPTGSEGDDKVAEV